MRCGICRGRGGERSEANYIKIYIFSTNIRINIPLTPVIVKTDLKLSLYLILYHVKIIIEYVFL